MIYVKLKFIIKYKLSMTSNQTAQRGIRSKWLMFSLFTYFNFTVVVLFNRSGSC